MFKIFHLVRRNGSKHLQNNTDIRQVTYLNMIWLFSYATIFLNFIACFSIYKSNSQFFILSSLVEQLLLWLVFLLVRFNKANIAKHIFLFVVYGTIFWHEQFYGKNAYTSIYYITFLPTALNIFSVNKSRITVAFYLLMPLIFALISEIGGTAFFFDLTRDETIISKLRLVNIFYGFILCLLYTSYMVINSGNKQNKLIIQSVGLQTTIDNAIGAIWSIDANYNILTVNKLFSEFATNEFGLEGIKVDSNLREMFSNKLVPDFIVEHYRRALKGESIFENFEFREKNYELKATPIYDYKTENIVGATFTCSDITNKVAAEKTLIMAKQKAEDASMAKERFLSNMSHELRTPLNGIVGITNIMLDEVYLPEQQKHFETLKNLSDHTLGVVNNILDISKIDAEKTILSNNRFNLILFVKKLQSIFENTAKLKKIDFAVEVLGYADIFLKGDEIKLSQVLINLIGNSIKFTDKGFTKLIITIDEDTAKTGYTKLHFAVTDSGIGIHKKHQEKIFESFTQADENTTRKFGGTGLGITISEKILQLMDSKLTVESELGKGSTFSFTVELQKSSFIPKNKLDLQAATNYTLPNTKILLAEDNKINQLVAKRFLEKWNAQVTIVENGKEALDNALLNEYDVVLMDLDMPIMDGYEATSFIKETKPSLPIIALTAASFENMQDYLIKKGFADVVQKPFVPDEFFKKLTAILNIA
jgi:signal transduction histidine kinase